MIGEKIKAILEMNNISQKQFALSIKIPYTTLSGYLNNKHEPDFKTLIDIADALHVSVDYLLGHNTSEDTPLNSEELFILQYFRHLDIKQKELIRLQLELMNKQNKKD